MDKVDDHVEPVTGLQESSLDALYAAALPSTRGGHLYGAFPYPTKISPEAIAVFIAAHTVPGETIFDGFAGSGTTGLAALLCADPPDAVRDAAERLGLNVQWGPRNAVLYELSALGAFVGQTLCNPPDPDAFETAADELLGEARHQDDWVYHAIDPDGNNGTLRYVIWSDVLQCPSCEERTSLWNSSVTLDPARISSRFSCDHCGFDCDLVEAERLTTEIDDPVLQDSRRQRSRVIAQVHGTTGSHNWSRTGTDSDLALLQEIERQPLPDSIPNVEIPWGDLYRSGYHQGITHLHHFYTRRNLYVIGRLWERTAAYEPAIRSALQFWILSYNASHATIMTRVVAKSRQKELVLTSAQPGVLYVSGLPVEKNLFLGLQRKRKTIANAFRQTYGKPGSVTVRQRSSCDVDLPSNSVDYVFTDPPFGGNIPYSEVNFINEAWLGQHTEPKEEIIVNASQDKGVSEYESLLTKAFSEISRILKPHAPATAVFHSSTSGVWNALQNAYSGAGLSVKRASVLDKTQGSFKQVTTKGAVKGDPVLQLEKTLVTDNNADESVWVIAEKLLREASDRSDKTEQTHQRLYSRLVGHFLSIHKPVPIDANEFYAWYHKQTKKEAAKRC